jgi:hypothetical protein
MVSKIGLIVAVMMLLFVAAAACNDDDDGNNNGNGNSGEETPADETAPRTPEEGDDLTPDATSIQTPSPVPEVDDDPDLSDEDDASMLEATNAGLTALGAGDIAGLRAVMSAEANASTEDDEIQELIDCHVDAFLRNPPIGQIEGKDDRARVEVFYIISGDGGDRASARRWEYERQADGTWLLRLPPDCPPGE